MASGSEAPGFSFPPIVARGLADKLYDKRKAAALEVERLTREALSSPDKDKPRSIIRTLVNDYVRSLNSNARNGGLIGVAAACIALGTGEISSYLPTIIPPIVACLSDQDSRVRYYACEAMYNTAKVARGGILTWFNELFDALSKLSADPENSVKAGAELLDRLLKDIIAEGSLAGSAPAPLSEELSTTPPYLPRLPNFSLDRFIPLLKERVYAFNPNTRTFLVDWLLLLDSIPDLELIRYLPDFLDGLFGYLSDPNTEVRTRTGNLLAELLAEVREVEKIQADKRTREGKDDGRYVFGEGVKLDYGRMIAIVAPFLVSNDEETQATALSWTSEFILLAGPKIIPFVPALVGAILPCLAHASPRIRQIAAETNAGLFKFVLRIPDAPLAIEEVADEELPASPALTPTTPTPTTIDHSATLSALTNQFSADHEEPRIAAIDWLSMLQFKSPDRVLAGDGASGVALLKLLSDPSEEVVKRDLALLAQIATASDDEYFHRFVVNLLQLFASDRRLLEARGALIIRILCLSLDPERMFVSMASILETDGDTEFAGIMVQNLNIILMTAPELADLRRKLRETRSPEAAQLFGALYGSWCHNAVSTLALCLLAQAYEHAAGLLQIIADLEITVSLLVQVDKLVQLLESPVFTYLRLQLLDPSRYPDLYKCLYGIMMLLPQSSAFVTLRNRLNSVGNMLLFNVARPAVEGKSAEAQKEEGLQMDWADLTRCFREVQARHEVVRKLARTHAATRRPQRSRPRTEGSVDGLVLDVPQGARPIPS